MRGRRARGGDVRKIFLACHDLAGLRDPFLTDRALHSIVDRAFDAQPRVAPMFLVLSTATPFVRDAVATDVADAPIDNRDLAMIAIVQATEVRDREGMKRGQPHAGV